jgi:signal transduction histidine kinase
MEAGILLVDDYNNVLYSNEKMEKLLGSELNKKTNPSGILDATFHLVKDSIALKSHTRDMMKKRLEERDRELFFYATAEFFIRDYVPVFRDNRFFAHLFIFRNITHSKLQDLEVQKSYKRVRTIMDHSDVGVVLLSNNEKVLIVNNQFLRMFYIKEPSSFFVNQLFRVLWEKMCENVQIDGLSREQIFETACSGKRIINKEILINDSATLQCIIEPVVYENQMQKGIHETLIQVIDITPQRSIEHTLRTARMEAEAIANAKSHILTSMSHEIRTPLNGILGFSSILKEMLTDPYMHEMAEEIEQSGHRLLDTINAILDFSMLQSEKHPFKKTSVSVNHILHDQINTFEPMALQKKLYIYAKIKGVIGIAIAEQVLCKILYNLINNAIKYTTTGGVTVEASIVYVEGSEWLDLRVIDTGVGIDEFKHRTIFEPFRQESEGYGRAFEGTGLGLSLVKEYIQKLNGKLHLASRKDEGSTFMILLPNAYYENKDVAPEIIGTPPKQTEGFSNFDARSRFSRRNH